MGLLQLQNWGEGLPGRKLIETGALWTHSAVPPRPARPYRTLYILISFFFSFFFNFLLFSLEKGWVQALGWHPPPLMPAQRRGMALRGAEAPGAHLPRDGEGGRKRGEPCWAHQPQGKHSTCTAGRGRPSPLSGSQRPFPLWRIKDEERGEEL